MPSAGSIGPISGSVKLAHIDALAEAEKIPANYLVQILNELRGAGLITSKRGKQGGYALARTPKRSVWEIVEAIDPELLECKFDPANWRARLWCLDADRESLESKVSEFTLADMVVSTAGEMYYI